MTAQDERPEGAKRAQDYRSLQPGVRLEETITSVATDPVPDPHAGRNVDQHLALRED